MRGPRTICDLLAAAGASRLASRQPTKKRPCICQCQVWSSQYDAQGSDVRTVDGLQMELQIQQTLALGMQLLAAEQVTQQSSAAPTTLLKLACQATCTCCKAGMEFQISGSIWLRADVKDCHNV